MPTNVAIASGTSIAEASATAMSAAPTKVSSVTIPTNGTDGTHIFFANAVGGFARTCHMWGGYDFDGSDSLTGSDGLNDLNDSNASSDPYSYLPSYPDEYKSESDPYGYRPSCYRISSIDLNKCIANRHSSLSCGLGGNFLASCTDLTQFADTNGNADEVDGV
ncbi:hypothetical protein M422DRAFT_243128 [Sphaerobolus stellatus SS14]|nr:hypothetical protein M422DRAFT_243128 [Sphaerobolus stellatus SS14]